jgi:hypothetical protein
MALSLYNEINWRVQNLVVDDIKVLGPGGSGGLGDLIADGTAAFPGLAFTLDPTTGFYRIGASEVGLSLGGTLSFDFQPGALLVPAGTAALPGYAFIGNTGSGFSIVQGSRVSLSLGGNETIRFQTNGITFKYAVPGTTTLTSAPAVGFAIQTGAGTTALTLDTSQNATFAANVYAPRQASGVTPAYSFTGSTASGIWNVSNSGSVFIRSGANNNLVVNAALDLANGIEIGGADDANSSYQSLVIKAGNSGELRLKTVASMPVTFYTNSTLALTLDASQNAIFAGPVAGGTAAGSTLILESTTGAGTTDFIAFKTGSQLEAMRITSGQVVNIGVASTRTGQLSFLNATNANTFILQAGVTGANLTFTWPLAFPAAAAGSPLVSTSAGVMSFNTVTGTGSAVLQTSPSLTTPTLGVASATSINFGGSALANYVSRTAFTPTITFGGASVSITYGTQQGYYTQLGDMVFANGVITLTSKGSSVGSAKIGGLAVASNAAANNNGAGSFYGTNFGATVTGALMLEIAPGSTQMSLFRMVTGTATAAADTDFTNTTSIEFSIAYHV